MTSLGIDLSLRETGYVCLKNGTIIKQLLITSAPKIKTTLGELQRLLTIINNICATNLVNIDITVIEGLSYGAAFQSTSLMQLAGLNYMLRERIYHLNKQFIIIAPTQLKKFITGKGNCAKELMLLSTYKRYGVSFTNNNLCDAYGLAQVGLAYMNSSAKKLNHNQAEIVKQLHLTYD